MIETAVLEATGELIVIYHALKEETIWARPLSEWNAEVEVEPGGPSGGSH